MTWLSRGVNQYVVNVHYEELAQHFPQHVVYQALEHRDATREPIRAQSGRGDAKVFLPLVTFSDAHKIVGTPQIKLDEYSCLSELFQG